MSAEVAIRVYERSHAEGLVDDFIRPGGFTLTDLMVDSAGLVPGDVVVDIGCGPGASVEHLRRDRHLTAVGLDRSEALLRAARVGTVGTRAPLVRCDGGRLPLGACTVDAVLAECSMSLMPDLDATMLEIRRVLRPGGRLLWSDVYSRDQRGRAALQALPFESCIRGAAGRDELLAIVDRHGFDVLHWEDRSDMLRTFAAQLAWRGGSMRSFWCRAGGVADPDAVAAAMKAARPGYFAMTARLRDVVRADRGQASGGMG